MFCPTRLSAPPAFAQVRAATKAVGAGRDKGWTRRRALSTELQPRVLSRAAGLVGFEPTTTRVVTCSPARIRGERRLARRVTSPPHIPTNRVAATRSGESSRPGVRATRAVKDACRPRNGRGGVRTHWFHVLPAGIRRARSDCSTADEGLTRRYRENVVPPAFGRFAPACLPHDGARFLFSSRLPGAGAGRPRGPIRQISTASITPTQWSGLSVPLANSAITSKTRSEKPPMLSTSSRSVACAVPYGWMSMQTSLARGFRCL